MSGLRVGVLALMSSALMISPSFVNAHEVLPSIADMTKDGDALTFEVRISAESFVAGIDQSIVTDTNQSPQAVAYDNLRALDGDALEDVLRTFWPQMAQGINVQAGDLRLPLTFVYANVPPVGNVDDVRTSTVVFQAELPPDAASVSFAWAPEYGTLVLRQMGVSRPYDGFLMGGSSSPPISLSGGR